MGRIVEGIWDCENCGTKNIGASKRICPNCGAAMKEYRLPDGKKVYVNKQKEEAVKNTGAYWLCSYCDTYNDSNREACSQCGASKSESRENYLEHKVKRKMEEQEDIRRREQLKERVIEQLKSVDKEPFSVKPRRTLGKHLLKIPIFVALFGIVCFLLFSLFSFKNTHTETISSVSWERTYEVEVQKTVEESGWSVPQGGRVYDEKQELKCYEDVFDHYETKQVARTKQVVDHYEEVVTGYRDLGNEFYEEITSEKPVYRTETYYETEKEAVYRKEPVYDTKYYYEIDKWVHSRYLTENGTDKNPCWPDSSGLRDNERISGQKETYKIFTIDEDGKVSDYNLPISHWNEMDVGSTIEFETNLFGIIDKDSIKKAE